VKSKNPSGYRTVASDAANNDWIAY
jgi:hypothetical protein